MTLAIVIYLLIGCAYGVWYAMGCAKTDLTEKDRTETVVGAVALVAIWPLAVVWRAWRMWE